MSDEIEIGLRVLDRQLLDKDGRRCGNVDDLAIEGGVGDVPEVTHLLVGPGYWPQRAGWVGRLANTLGLVYLVVIMVVALSAIPLMILTNAGQN